MARIADTEAPSPRPARCSRIGHALCLTLLATPLTACGYADYTTDRAHFADTTQSSDNRTLGNIYLNLNKSETAVPYTVDITRVNNKSRGPFGSNKGYALSAPVYDNQDDFRSHLTLARTKDYNWFSGMQFRWEF